MERWIVGVNAILGNVLVTSAGEGWDTSRLLGDGILLVTGFVWTFYNLATRGVVARYPMPTVIFWQTAFGALFFLPVALLEQVVVGGGRWLPSGTIALIAVAHLGVLCSVLAFLLYARGLKGLDASSAVSVMNLVPIFGVLFAVLLLGEPLGLLQIIGGFVVIVGVTLSVRAETDRQPEMAAEVSVGEPRTGPTAETNIETDVERKVDRWKT
jgi:drug/metabolite transporter (DMT)-like permease